MKHNNTRRVSRRKRMWRSLLVWLALTGWGIAALPAHADDITETHGSGSPVKK